MHNPTEEGEREPMEPRLVTIPEMPDLLEAAGIKRVGPARIRQLAASDPDMPQPVFERGRLRLYDWKAVEPYFRHRETRQGERTDLGKRTTQAE